MNELFTSYTKERCQPVETVKKEKDLGVDNGTLKEGRQNKVRDTGASYLDKGNVYSRTVSVTFCP